MTRTIQAILAALVLSVLVFARGGDAHGSDRPWAAGVAPEQQAEALKKFTEGTSFLKEAYFKRAVDRYREALALWDHPAIHFNIAKALMNLDYPVEAYGHLKSAMRFGGAPLEPTQIAQIPELEAQLFRSELAELSVNLSEPGAILRVNGAEVARGVQTWSGIIRAGKTVILATKDGFQPTQAAETFEPGTKPAVSLSLVKIDLNVRFTREMAVWKPWTVFGAGLLGVGAGIYFNRASAAAYGNYDASVEACAESAVSLAPVGNQGNADYRTCLPDAVGPEGQPLVDHASLDRADLFQTLSIVGFAAGGATLATGIALLYINREKLIEGSGSADLPVALTPAIGPGLAGLNATIQF